MDPGHIGSGQHCRCVQLGLAGEQLGTKADPLSCEWLGLSRSHGTGA